MFFGSRFFFHASFVLSNTYGLFGSSVISPAETAVGVLGGGFCEVLGAIDFGVVLVLELALAVSLSFFFCSARMVLCILPDLSVIRYDYTLVADVHISPSSMTFFFFLGGGGISGFWFISCANAAETACLVLAPISLAAWHLLASPSALGVGSVNQYLSRFAFCAGALIFTQFLWFDYYFGIFS